PPHARSARGLAYVPEDRRIVKGLTVFENMRLGIVASRHKSREAEIIEQIPQTFPRLKERLNENAVTMSGGAQQMRAISRASAAEPDMILLDEPCEGIMPILVDEMCGLFTELKKDGKTILLVEQNVELALEISDRVYIVDQGEVVYSSSARALLDDPEMQERYCAV